MESSRRAVESYWRSRTIDAATSDEDKVAPVYKLEEICDMLRTSHVSIVREISEFVLKRLDHKSPVVKQKALRLIKYCVAKSGAEFRREMQRNSAAVRNLIHYKGQPDVLKGDALNKAVRATASEAIAAIFSEETKREAPKESSSRIEGFGNKNMENPSEDRKSFISEVVGIGSASIMHGINNIAQAHNLRKNENGSSYRTPNLQRSFFTDSEPTDTYEPVRLPNQAVSQRRGLDTDYGFNNEETTSGDSHKEAKTREEKLLDTIATSGGVRLQPTRDAIQVFLTEAAKMNPMGLNRAVEAKLQSPIWQVRLKTLCVVESLLRKKDEEVFAVIFSYFDENRELIITCSESPQSSLREKANRILTLLGGKREVIDSGSGSGSVPVSVPVPDLIDTGYENEVVNEERSDKVDSFVDDLLGERLDAKDDDPFNDVKFHTDDLLGGAPVDDGLVTPSKNRDELVDFFGDDEPKEEKNGIGNLMNDLSLNGDSAKTTSESLFSDFGFASVGSNSVDDFHGSKPALEGADGSNPDLLAHGPNSGLHATYGSAYGLNQGLQGMYGSNQGLPGTFGIFGLNPGLQGPYVLNQGVQSPYTMNHGLQVPYGLNPGMMGGYVLNPGFQSQPLGFMGHQPVATMNPNGSYGLNPGGALPDIFQLGNNGAVSIPTARKEETRAFDFISEHVAAARDQKKVA